MARTPRPWYRSARDEWRVTVRGTDVSLGKHPPGYPAPRRQRGRWNAPQPVLDRFHALLAATPPAAPVHPAARAVTVADVFEFYLAWCQLNRSPRTYEWSRDHIQSFCDALKTRPTPVLPAALPATDLAPYHVTEWVDANRRPRPGRRVWGPNHVRGAVTAVQRAFAWAETAGHLARSPIRHVEKPPPRRREQVLTPAEFDALLAQVKDAAFWDVLVFCWETGCRVQEVRVLAAAHYRPDRGRFELPPPEAKGGGGGAWCT